MSDKLPQPSDVLSRRLRRVAKWLDRTGALCAGPDKAQWAARSNTCWQAAARLDEVHEATEHVKDVLFEAVIRSETSMSHRCGAYHPEYSEQCRENTGHAGYHVDHDGNAWVSQK